jgi:hypothetical protein
LRPGPMDKKPSREDKFAESLHERGAPAVSQGSRAEYGEHYTGTTGRSVRNW